MSKPHTMNPAIYPSDALSTTLRRSTQDPKNAPGEARTRRQTLQQPDGSLERTVSSVSIQPNVPKKYGHSRENSASDMSHAKAPTSSSSTSSSSETAHQSLLSNPYETRYERRYLRELPYPLPVDLVELQRQNLKTLLCCRVFGSAVCSPNANTRVPRRVLELGCGSGLWSAMCHDFFRSLGHSDVSFTGLDVAPLATDLNKQGVNWTFVQHDLRRVPFPFDDEQFDLVMVKDLSLVIPMSVAAQRLIDDSIRILSPGGTLEIWESDHLIRSLLPHPPISTSQHVDHEHAIETGTFLISPATPFAPAQNRFIVQANAWIQEALDRRKYLPAPCTTIADTLHQQVDDLDTIGSRRIAMPLSELRWESDGSKNSRYASEKGDHWRFKGKQRASEGALNAEQASLRQTALVTVVQMIESLEPLLKEVNGKNAEEWAGWWAAMMRELLSPSKNALNGECLEIGAWWATKIVK